MRVKAKQALQRGIRPVAFIAINGSFLFANKLSRLFVKDPARDPHRSDLRAEESLLLRASGALLTQKRVFILRFATHSVSLSDHFGGIAHHRVAPRHFVPETRMRGVVSRNNPA